MIEGNLNTILFDKNMKTEVNILIAEREALNANLEHIENIIAMEEDFYKVIRLLCLYN